MSPLLIKISKDFATLWTTIDPIGNVALFAGLTAALTRAERRRTALRATIYASCIRRNPKAFGDDVGKPPRRASSAGHQLAHARRRENPRTFSEKNQNFDNFASLFP